MLSANFFLHFSLPFSLFFKFKYEVKDEMKEYMYKYDSPAGILTIRSDGVNITGLWIKEPDVKGDTEIQEVSEYDLSVFKVAKKWLDIYFIGKEPNFIPPLKTNGTIFREAVWEMLREIPYGQVITYGDIAKKMTFQIGKAKMSAQAVGGAVGSNPISILIPCHRVVGVNGNLTGYGGGLDIKVQLLQLEGLDMERFYTP